METQEQTLEQFLDGKNVGIVRMHSAPLAMFYEDDERVGFFEKFKIWYKSLNLTTNQYTLILESEMFTKFVVGDREQPLNEYELEMVSYGNGEFAFIVHRKQVPGAIFK